MCGINAIFSYRGPTVDVAELVATRDRMKSRGPDGVGLWTSDDGRVGLGHTRLAVIDQTALGAQPMIDRSGRYIIVFNGEIYNFRHLRDELLQRGVLFHSTSDTEVLLALFVQHGPTMLDRLRGMFAFVIWDLLEQKLFMARDHFGIKPLYFSDDGRVIRIASQVKALLAGGGVPHDASEAGHVGFFLFGSVPSPYTLYRRIEALPAGTALSINASGSRTSHRFFDISDEIRRAETEVSSNRPRSDSLLRSALYDSVHHHLVSDVPVGVFLSAGIDSGSLLMIAQAMKNDPINAFTLGFSEYRDSPNDETTLASLVARTAGAKHQVAWLGAADFRDEIDNVFDMMDQPSIDGINTYFVSKVTAGGGVKVALSGVGGDELFAGYQSFHKIPKLVRAAASLRNFTGATRLVRRLTASVADLVASPKYAGLFEYSQSIHHAYFLERGVFMPWELTKVLDPDLVERGLADLQPFERLEQTHRGIAGARMKITALELEWYMGNQLMRDTDWAGMAHSLEIRVPLVDVVFVRQILPLLIAGVANKRQLGEASKRPLPVEITQRPKTGFGVPIREWLLDGKKLRDRSKSGHRAWAAFVYDRFRNNATAARTRS